MNRTEVATLYFLLASSLLIHKRLRWYTQKVHDGGGAQEEEIPLDKDKELLRARPFFYRYKRVKNGSFRLLLYRKSCILTFCVRRAFYDNLLQGRRRLLLLL